MRVIEFYCGLGGFAAAAEERAEVVAAFDISPHVLQGYEHNWRHPAYQRDILSMSADELRRLEADMWWMSPPCTPHTARGLQRDLDDPRSRSFLHLLELLNAVRPPFVGLENVPGFEASGAHRALLEVLEGYAIRECLLCPTEIGVPNRRLRYYLVASADRRWPYAIDALDFHEQAAREARFNVRDGGATQRVEHYLDAEVGPAWHLADPIWQKYGRGIHIVDSDARETSCFTGAYGKSWTSSGSYLRTSEGRARFFTPTEIARFLGFDDAFRLPPTLGRRQQWKYLGNSLSVKAMRRILQPVLGPSMPVNHQIGDAFVFG